MGYCSLRVVTEPAAEPISLDEAKAHLRVDHDADDTLIGTYISAARAQAEGFLRRALIDQTLCYTLSPSQPPASLGGLSINPIIFVMPLNWWPVGGQAIELPMPPVQSITEVKQRLRDGTVTTLSASTDFYADASNEPARVTLRNLTQPLGSDLAITYSAGYGADGSKVPPAIRHAIKLLLGGLYEHRGDEDGEWSPAVERLLTPHRNYLFSG